MRKVEVVVVLKVVGDGRAIDDHETVDLWQRPWVSGEVAEECVGAEEDSCVSFVERVTQLYAERASEQAVIRALSTDVCLLQESQSVSDTDSAQVGLVCRALVAGFSMHIVKNIPSLLISFSIS